MLTDHHRSLGCLTHEMLLGRSAFGMLHTDTEDEIYRKITLAEPLRQKVEDNYLTEAAKAFLRGLLAIHPKARLTVSGALAHVWVTFNTMTYMPYWKHGIWANWKSNIPYIERLDVIPEVKEYQREPLGIACQSYYGNIVTRIEKPGNASGSDTVFDYRIRKRNAQMLDNLPARTGLEVLPKRQKRSIELTPIVLGA